MKKKIKLRGELAIIMLISLVVSFVLVLTLQGFGFFSGKPDKAERIEKIYDEYISELESELSEQDDITKINNILQSKYKHLVGYEFYVTDEEGNVLASTNSGVKLIARDQITDNLCVYEEDDTDENVYKVTGCDALENGLYLYYVYLRYENSDTGIVIWALIGALVFFLILIWGRVSYISVIRASVGKIAEGNLSQRVPYRYKNELRGLAEDINVMAASLESEEQKKNEFLTNISHDIRTPLTTILGYLDMIKNKKYDSSEELDGYISIMERKGAFLASMLEDFFQYSKLASEDITLNLQEFELNELLRQFKEDETSEFEENQLSLEITLYSEPIVCKGDVELLARVVSNLLGNALKYAKKDTTVYLRSDVTKENGCYYANFFVSNTPADKITQEEVTLLFERLYKRDYARKEEGSGLGLSIAQNIVKLHNGKIMGYIENDNLVFRVKLLLTGKQN